MRNAQSFGETGAACGLPLWRMLGAARESVRALFDDQTMLPGIGMKKFRTRHWQMDRCVPRGIYRGGHSHSATGTAACVGTRLDLHGPCATYGQPFKSVDSARSSTRQARRFSTMEKSTRTSARNPPAAPGNAATTTEVAGKWNDPCRCDQCRPQRVHGG